MAKLIVMSWSGSSLLEDISNNGDSVKDFHASFYGPFV